MAELTATRKSSAELEISDPIMELEARHTSGAYPKRPLAIVRGRGAQVWDADGRRYLDLTGAQGVALLGHCHPQVVAAVREQVDRLISCPEIFYNDRRAELYAALSLHLPTALDRFFLCNSGAEAIEGALKLARLLTGRTEILAAQGSFHGRTLGALSTTWNSNYRQPFEPLIPGITHVAYNDIAAAEATIRGQTAAVLLEVIQGEGGVHPADAAYLQAVRELCDRHGSLLIFDEIQTGLGRTGRWFAFERSGVIPDVLCLGKGIAGGLPLGLVAWRGERGRLPEGSHGSTFGGNPLAAAAAVATLQVLEAEKLPDRSASLGDELTASLRRSDARMIREIRGFGLMIGIELRKRVTPVLKALLARGVLALPAGPMVLRLLPPLVVSADELAQGREAILESLEVLEDG